MPEMDKYQRLVLANQYRILERLANIANDETSATSYDRSAEALEDGYQSAIDNLFDRIFDGLPREECSFVVTSMAMFDALQRSFDALTAEKREGIEEYRINGFGFDGNNETEYMAYARFIVEKEQRFTQLRNDDNFNSHFPNVDRYRPMLHAWEHRFERSYALSRDAIEAILNAG
jgi:uncharacterized protein